MTSDAFFRRLETLDVIADALASRKGAILTPRQCYDLWQEHSEDYCVGWLAFRAPNNPSAEILEAYTKWQERHTPKL